MLKNLRIWLTYGALALAFLGALFVVGYLQEFATDDIPDLAREAGISLPLEDPQLLVNLQRMTLSLFEGEVLIKRYDIGFGSKTAGRLHDRVGSTPLGEYSIVAIREYEDIMTRGTGFLIIDFPSPDDAERALDNGVITQEEFRRLGEARSLGEPPPGDTGLAGPVGIQGNYFFFQDRRFTDGSIALSNGDINEIIKYVRVGTPIVIKQF